MKTEVEVKFLDVDFADIRARLERAGAVCKQPMRAMHRVTINTPGMITNKAYLRVRDEGDKVTLTYKQFDSMSVDGAKEIELHVSSFEETVALLAKAGLKHSSFQETRRETWELDSVEVVLDEWPWLRPYIEIEGASEELLHACAQKLGFNWDDASFGDAMVAYRAQYPHLTESDNIGSVPEARFGAPLPDLLKK